MPSDSEKRQFSWRGFRKISAELPILHASRHVCGIGGHTRTDRCLWRFSLQMHCNAMFTSTCFLFTSLDDLWLIILARHPLLGCSSHISLEISLRNLEEILALVAGYLMVLFAGHSFDLFSVIVDEDLSFIKTGCSYYSASQIDGNCRDEIRLPSAFLQLSVCSL